MLRQRAVALGFKPRLLLPAFKPLSHLTLEGDKQRFKCLKKSLLAQDSFAVWCVRGGYGCQRLMPFLLRMTPPPRPKLFIGYSDATVLHIFFNEKWGWPTLHFPVVNDLPLKQSPAGRKALAAFKQIVCFAQTCANKAAAGAKEGQLGSDDQSFKELKILNAAQCSKIKFVRSILRGGNMTIIQTSIGTPFAGSFKKAVLFLEDVGEAAYRVDRALWQMQTAGVFKNVKALVLGDFLPKTKAVERVLKNFAAACSFPVIAGVPCGHGGRKHPLPFNTKCLLRLNHKKAKAQLDIKNPF